MINTPYDAVAVAAVVAIIAYLVYAGISSAYWLLTEPDRHARNLTEVIGVLVVAVTMMVTAVVIAYAIIATLFHGVTVILDGLSAAYIPITFLLRDGGT